jgi:predicted small lipoprotein YifL
MLIDEQLHPALRSLTPVITGCNRKGPLFVPVEDLAPDESGP